MISYAVVGTGAIGGFYGGMLAKAGKEVHFLFHSDYDYVRENGLKIDSVNGDFHLKEIHAYHSTADMPPCDVVLVGLKSTNNHLLKKLLPPLLKKETIVVLIQNGLGLEEDLQADFPELNIAGGLAFICSQKVSDGYIQHMDYGKLNLGSYSCKDQKRLEEICNDLNQAGIKAEILELEKARWMKLVWNIPYNGMTVILNTSTDKLMNYPAMEELLREIMLEVIRAANHTGKNRFWIPESYAEEMLELTRKMTPYSPSMKLDFDFKRPLEIEYIYSRPIETACKAGYDSGRISVIEKQLKFIENSYRKN